MFQKKFTFFLNKKRSQLLNVKYDKETLLHHLLLTRGVSQHFLKFFYWEECLNLFLIDICIFNSANKLSSQLTQLISSTRNGLEQFQRCNTIFSCLRCLVFTNLRRYKKTLDLTSSTLPNLTSLTIDSVCNVKIDSILQKKLQRVNLFVDSDEFDPSVLSFYSQIPHVQISGIWDVLPDIEWSGSCLQTFCISKCTKVKVHSESLTEIAFSDVKSISCVQSKTLRSLECGAFDIITFEDQENKDFLHFPLLQRLKLTPYHFKSLLPNCFIKEVNIHSFPNLTMLYVDPLSGAPFLDISLLCSFCPLQYIYIGHVANLIIGSSYTVEKLIFIHVEKITTTQDVKLFFPNLQYLELNVDLLPKAVFQSCWEVFYSGCAPNLQTLDISGSFENLDFCSVFPSLQKANIFNGTYMPKQTTCILKGSKNCKVSELSFGYFHPHQYKTLKVQDFPLLQSFTIVHDDYFCYKKDRVFFENVPKSCMFSFTHNLFETKLHF